MNQQTRELEGLNKMNREPYQGPQGGPPPPPGPVNQATPRASDAAAKMLYNCAGNITFNY